MQLPRLGDIFAIPFFFALTIYFSRESKKRTLTLEEKILFLFASIGFVADVFFVLMYR
jgi:hypothetical protein